MRGRMIPGSKASLPTLLKSNPGNHSSFAIIQTNKVLFPTLFFDAYFSWEILIQSSSILSKSRAVESAVSLQMMWSGYFIYI